MSYYYTTELIYSISDDYIAEELTLKYINNFCKAINAPVENLTYLDELDCLLDNYTPEDIAWIAVEALRDIPAKAVIKAEEVDNCRDGYMAVIIANSLRSHLKYFAWYELVEQTWKEFMEGEDTDED